MEHTEPALRYLTQRVGQQEQKSLGFSYNCKSSPTHSAVSGSPQFGAQAWSLQKPGSHRKLSVQALSEVTKRANKMLTKPRIFILTLFVFDSRIVS